MQKLNQGGTEKAVHVAAHALIVVFLPLLIFSQGRVELIINGSELVGRLIDCGFTESTAWDTCMKYAADGDFSGLKEYIRQQEILYDDRKQYV